MQVHETQAKFEADSGKRELVERVASSAPLRKSPRLRELFLYLCEQTLNGETGNLHEQAIGEQVFGRQLGYDTGADNIVRVSVFQLRKKLEQYFAEEGATEPFIITIPKGRYQIEFQPLLEHGTEPSGVTASRLPERRKWLWMIAAAAGTAVVLLLIWHWSGSGGGSVTLQAHERFWRGLFTPDREAYIVVADSGFSLLQDVTGKTLSLEEYLKNPESPLRPDSVDYPPELLRRLAGRQYTSVTDASIAFRLGAINRALGGRAVVRSARSIDIRDLKMHNVVLLGSLRSNPWVVLFRDRLKFQLDYDSHPPRGFVRNRAPEAGEPEVFRATAMAGQSGDAFGVVSYLPNLDGTGKIVGICGTNMEGTEAAAEMLLNNSRFEEIAERLAAGSGEIPYFEAVIRAASFGGAGSAPEIVAISRITGR